MKIPTRNLTLAKTYFRTDINTGFFTNDNNFPFELNVEDIENMIATNKWVSLIKVLRTIGGYSLKEAKEKIDYCRFMHDNTIDRVSMWAAIIDTIDAYNDIISIDKSKKIIEEQFPVLFENSMIKVFKNPSNEIFIVNKHSDVQLRICDIGRDLSIVLQSNVAVIPTSCNGLPQIIVKNITP